MLVVLLYIGGSSLPTGISISLATIIGNIPKNSNKFLSSNLFAKGPIAPKHEAPTIPPTAIVIPKYLTVSSLDHAHISIANGVEIL